ncbi:hypothetical protein [Ruicaihuangia caeni]|uniref:Uncharacterized protein n=1 Tax=Ruicaihuangia caeni TaxID=3042517 RepID=A0AAW6T6T7_9MICO|nr:hypothetical protein [Klugiella sp. YN-L-19]MDI2099530.1 hypothetical protein [Klugiella sp. YN-L-19]
MSDDTALPPGRPIRLAPLPPGLWGLLLGAGVALLAPLMGFLIGSIIGPGDTQAAINPMFLALFAGIVIGAGGAIWALVSALRLIRHVRRTPPTPARPSSH